MLIEVNKLISCRPAKKLIKTILIRASQIAGAKKEIKLLSVALVDKKTIRLINKKYRQVDKETDVLAFEEPSEIIVCWDQLVKQAKEQKHSQNKELIILLIHGLLHILGYDHKSKAGREEMEKMSAKILSLIRYL